METRYETWLESLLGAPEPREQLGLVVLWSRDEHARLGEIALVPPGEAWSLGRASPEIDRQLGLVQQRPGENVPTGPLRSERVSRRQLTLQARADGRMVVRNQGRARLLIDGVAQQQATIGPGDIIEIERRLLLMCVRRPATLPGDPAPAPPFGGPDASGFVGESPAAWQLRSELRFIARRSAHVLILGDSGAGKELAAQSLHLLSRRSGRLISRNAATLPQGLIDAELFGNVRNYPNPGMTERPGLIGAADRGTLFLDEIGEMPTALQAHLLRVLDSGEYQRLGEARPRRCDLRLVAATNRDPSELKHDFLARLRLRVQLPGLNTRREDIPLIARHLIRRMAADDPEIAARCFEGGDPSGEPRLSPRFIQALVARQYETHVREMEERIWRSMAISRGRYLELPPEERSPSQTQPDEIGPDQIRAALEACDGVRTRAAERMGLRNRHQLLRLMRKYGIE